MTSISIVYFSGSGSTAQMAEAAARGARGVPGASVTLLPIRGEHIEDGRWSDPATLAILDAADAILFASPTYMGGAAAQFKAFADATAGVWYRQGWRDKLAGGMTVSNSPSGDKLHTLSYFSVFAAQHGMQWLSAGQMPMQADGVNRLGSMLGVMGQNVGTMSEGRLHEDDAKSAELYGHRLADMARRLTRRTAEA